MSEMITANDVSAYLARPDGEVKAGVLVIHEVWGLTDHIKSVADRLASEGYLALTPDLLAGSGVDFSGTKELQEVMFDPERRNEAQPKLRAMMAPMQKPEFSKVTAASTKKCFDYLYDLPESKHSVAVIGFCFGGSYSFTLAAQEPRLKLSMPFYGHCDFSSDELAQIACPVRAFYGENDEGLSGQMQELPAKMSEAKADFEQRIYDDCGHAFFNDTNKFAYNQVAASNAWDTVLAELAKIQ